MQERNSIDQIVCAARDRHVGIDAVIAAATRSILQDPFLREATVKRMMAEIVIGKRKWDEPPLAQMISDYSKAKAYLAERKEAGKRIDPTNFRWSI